MAAPSPASAANLLKNPGFETGTFVSWARDGVTVQNVLKRTGKFAVSPRGDDADRITYTSQAVGVGAFAGLIDANQAAVTTGCYHSGYDKVYVRAYFYDAAGKPITGKSIVGTPPGTHARWKKLQLTRLAVPPLTRSIRLRIEVRAWFDFPDSEWDDAFMVLLNR